MIGALAVRFPEIDDQIPLGHRPLQPPGQTPGSARIARDRQPCASGPLVMIGPSSLPSCYRLVSRSIGEPFPDFTTDRAIGPLDIVNAESDPIIVPEIELGKVTMKVFLAYVLIDPIDPALENREDSLRHWSRHRRERILPAHD